MWLTESQRAFKAPRNKKQRKRKPINDSWVIVQKDGHAVMEGDVEEIFVIPPLEDEKQDSRRSESTSSRVVEVTRELPDTSWNRIFKKPLPHNFGNGNTNPSVASNMMKTFNVRALENREGKKQVYDTAQRANDLRHTSSLIQHHEDSVPPGPVTDEEEEEIEVIVQKPRVYGKPSVPRTSEPSMFEILSWSG